MKKTALVMLVLLLTALVIGCKAKETPKMEETVEDREISTDLTGIDSLEEDLNMTELDEIDQELAGLEG